METSQKPVERMIGMYVCEIMRESVYLQGYLMSLGKKRTEEVKRDARIGEAEATKDSGIKVM